jgi:hypothetical protein
MNKKPASKSKAKIPPLEILVNDKPGGELANDIGVFPLEEDLNFIAHIEATYGINPIEVAEVLKHSKKDEFNKRYKLAELAAIMKKKYDMTNYIRNAELVKKYGREGITAIVTAAKKSKVHPYHADKVAVWLGLDNAEDVIQMIPYREEVRDLTKLLTADVVPLRAYDESNRLYIFFHNKSDAEFSAKAEGKSKEEVEKILITGNVKYKNMYSRFYLLKGILTPDIKSREDLEDGENQEQSIPFGAKITPEHLTHGVYTGKDDPLKNFTCGLSSDEVPVEETEDSVAGELNFDHP